MSKDNNEKKIGDDEKNINLSSNNEIELDFFNVSNENDKKSTTTKNVGKKEEELVVDILKEDEVIDSKDDNKKEDKALNNEIDNKKENQVLNNKIDDIKKVKVVNDIVEDIKEEVIIDKDTNTNYLLRDNVVYENENRSVDDNKYINDMDNQPINDNLDDVINSTDTSETEDDDILKENSIKRYKIYKLKGLYKNKSLRLIATGILVIIAIFFVLIVLKNTIDINKERFHGVSTKPYIHETEKERIINEVLNKIKYSVSENLLYSSTNLNFSKMYNQVNDEDEIKKPNSTAPLPVTIEDEKKETEIQIKSVAEQVYEKLVAKYDMFLNELQGLLDVNPVSIVRGYNYNGFSIIGDYNPEDKSHVFGKKHTYFIKNFSNINYNFVNSDLQVLEEGHNLKDIMSMASVYSYYHNMYDYDTFLKQCYSLFDNSYTYIPSISEIYYCSGCTFNGDIEKYTEHPITINKIPLTHSEQKVVSDDYSNDLGVLKRVPDGTCLPLEGTYEEYIQKIFNGEKVSNRYNYCPGHVDLNVTVVIKTIDDTNGLFSVDSEYGLRGRNYTKIWHGWDADMKGKVRELAGKDWLKEYGLDTSFIKQLTPLTQEEINYFLNRLPDELSQNRVNVIKTALISVSRIPYYYGGKALYSGYEKNTFGKKIKSDYKGRMLKGLDCSGWINWVYLTTFNKRIVQSEGTVRLANEGQRIRREELLPGDIIVRPGIDSHVMMFLEWEEEGKMRVIHENGGVDNVSIGVFEAYYPYYRRLISS